MVEHRKNLLRPQTKSFSIMFMLTVSPEYTAPTFVGVIEKCPPPFAATHGVMVTTQGSNFPATGALGLVGGQAREMTGEQPEVSGVTRLPKRQIPRQRA